MDTTSSLAFTLLLVVLDAALGASPVVDKSKTTKQSDLNYTPHVTEGYKYEFKCTASGTQPISYIWKKDGKAVEPTKDGRVKVSKGVVTFSALKYTEDDGKYQCIAKNKEGTDTSEILTLKVAVVGNFAPECQESGTAITINATIGKSLELKCPDTTYFYPKAYDWGFKRNGPADSIKVTTRRSILKSGSLYYSYIEESDITYINDKGGIRCVIHSGGQEVVSCPFLLKKIEGVAEDFGPIMMQKLENRTEVEGAYVDMSCIASGRPTPTMKWYRGNEELTGRPYILTDSNLKLSIRPLSKAYEGMYKCEATSTYGGKDRKVFSMAYLKVEVKPSWKTELQDVTKTEGATLTEVCSAAGDPKPKYAWFKSGKIVKSGEKVKIDSGSMIISQLTVNDSGTYQCSAMNKHGTIYSSMTLTVKKVTTPAPTTTKATTTQSTAPTTEKTAPKTSPTTRPTTRATTASKTVSPKAQNRKVTDNDGNSASSVALGLVLLLVPINMVIQYV